MDEIGQRREPGLQPAQPQPMKWFGAALLVAFGLFMMLMTWGCLPLTHSGKNRGDEK